VNSLLTLSLLALLQGSAPALATSGAQSAGETAKEGQPPLPFLHDLALAFDLAGYENRPIFLHLSAPWCEACTTLKTQVYTSPAVRSRLERFIRVELDVEQPKGKRAWMAYGVSSLPTALVLRQDKASLDRFRVTALMEPEALAALLDRAIEATGAPPAAARDGGALSADGASSQEEALPPWLNVLWLLGCGLLLASWGMMFRARGRPEA
jgi:thiol:disulfide interchange protein